MKKEQVKASGLLIFSNLVINLAGFLRQVIMAAILGISGNVDILLLAMIAPALIQSMIGGGAGEIMVIKRDRPGLKEGSFESVFIVSCLLPVALIGIIYYFSIGLLLPFFEIQQSGEEMFKGMSLIFLVNMIPGTFTSVLRPHLYSKGLYRFYTLSTVISQLSGILFIILTVKYLGVYSFAWSYLFANTVNAIWYSFRAGLSIRDIFSFKVWKHEFEQLAILIKRVFSLSIQTLLNNFATFWERSLSVKFLSAGYLSSLNYSKTIAELPNTVLLSSVLTTSYIEQTALHKNDEAKFADYTAKTFRLLINAGFLFQAIMLLLAPVIIILVFRRGKFDNEAVRTTLVIFNILTVGFLPRLIMNYFSRTMYILGEYKKLFYGVLLKFLLHVGIMIAFIKLARNTIPFATITGFLFLSILLFIWISAKIRLPSIGYYLFRLLIVSVSSFLLLLLHNYTLEYYINRTNLEICIFSIPLVLISMAAFLIFLKRNGIEVGLLERLKASFRK